MNAPLNRFSSTMAPPSDLGPFDGVLLVDKPEGPTSHDIVDKIRRTFNIKKVGHGGTLDPMATGLLVILLGRGTKLSNKLMGSDKTYEGTLTLGSSTSSQDAQGETISEGDPSGISEEDVKAQMKAMVGDSFQLPPMVSAIKINGVPLYKHARKGKEVKREPRFIHIYSFKLTRFENPEADFVVKSTKGTYVRTLCHDIGANLECGGHLSALRRTRSGSLNLDDALPLDRIMELSPTELAKHVIPVGKLA
jgi:tRNA pseudouridine55 synthase